jgi:hypothetical protein
MAVLRDRRTYWSLLFAPLMWAACAAVGEPWLDVVTFVLGVGAILVETLVYPPWIRTDASGVTVAAWFRRRLYPWASVETFDVGNPRAPDIAYMLLKPDQGTGARTVRLPNLETLSPLELVERLRTEQQRWSPSAEVRPSFA